MGIRANVRHTHTYLSPDITHSNLTALFLLEIRFCEEKMGETKIEHRLIGNRTEIKRYCSAILSGLCNQRIPLLRRVGKGKAGLGREEGKRRGGFLFSPFSGLLCLLPIWSDF